MEKNNFIGEQTFSYINNAVKSTPTVQPQKSVINKILGGEVGKTLLDLGKSTAQQLINRQINKSGGSTSAAMLPKTAAVVQAERVLQNRGDLAPSRISFKTPLIIGGAIIAVVLLFVLLKK